MPDSTYHEVYSRIPLFQDLTHEELQIFLQSPFVVQKKYHKGNHLFRMGDEPAFLFILLRGSVFVCHDSEEGRRSIVATFDRPGETMGGAYLFLEGKRYNRYAEAAEETTVLLINKGFFHEIYLSCSPVHAKIIFNFLRILSGKAYMLNQKLHLLSSGNLRRKIAVFLLQQEDVNSLVNPTMNREELSDYLGVARPSLSRELMRMQEDGLISIEGKFFRINNRSALEKIREGS